MPRPPSSTPTLLTSVRAWSYLGINLFATPGLGSVMGGHKAAGRGQLVFSVTGFCLIVTWIFKISIGNMMSQLNEADAAPVPAWWWEYGALSFGIAWAWSFATSVSMILEARKNVAKLPPKLDLFSRPTPPKL